MDAIRWTEWMRSNGFGGLIQRNTHCGVFDTQRDAIDRGREIAQTDQTELRIQDRQPVRIGRRLGGSAFRARLRGKRVKSAFFETYGQPP